jgi:hypothetical protein
MCTWMLKNFEHALSEAYVASRNPTSVRTEDRYWLQGAKSAFLFRRRFSGWHLTGEFLRCKCGGRKSIPRLQLLQWHSRARLCSLVKLQISTCFSKYVQPQGKVWLGHGTEDPGFEFQRRQKILLFSNTSGTAVVPTQTYIQRAPLKLYLHSRYLPSRHAHGQINL